MDCLFLVIKEANIVGMLKCDKQNNGLLVRFEFLNICFCKLLIFAWFFMSHPVHFEHFIEIGLGAEPIHVYRLRKHECHIAISVDICDLITDLFLTDGLTQETSEL